MSGAGPSGLLADVAVDLDVWALDRPLTYSVPESLAPRLRMGSVVRVPLRGRRVRGWVLGVREGQDPAALAILRVSGRAPVLDHALLAACRDLARRQVHPLASFLRIVTPPRLGRGGRADPPAPAPPRGPGRATLWRIGPADDPAARYAAEVERVLAAGTGAIVAVPEVREGSQVLERLADAFPQQAAAAHSGMDPAARAEALWSVALGERQVLLGSRASVLAPAFHPAAPLGLVVVHHEHDRSLKEQRAPYYHAREAALARAARAGADVLLASPTPSLRALGPAAAGWTLEEPPRAAERAAWPVVEVVEPARGPLPRRAVAAILEALRRGGRVLVLLPRTGPTPAGPGPDELAGYLARVVPGARVTRADRPSLGAPGALEEALGGDVVVATEAALADVERPRVSVAVALGVDAMLARPSGRAVEEAFATLWAAAAAVAGRPGGRLLLETRAPEHHAVQGLTRGDYHYFARHELAARRATASPPFTTLVRLQASALADPERERLAALPGTEVLGPVEGRIGVEVLLKVEELEAVLDPLRAIVASSGERMLVEVDPRDW